MTLLQTLVPLVLAQVGPNPNAIDIIGNPDDLVRRPPRQRSLDEEIADPKAAWLGECLQLIETDPARAHSQAQIKLGASSGADAVIANHCLGLAATKLSLWDDATTAFAAARQGTPLEEIRARARFAAMAGNAALGAGNAALALSHLQTARAEAQEASSADLQAIAATDAARALVALDRADEALAALDEATALAPGASEGWLLKATLLRRLGQLSGAQGAIEKAAELAPQEGAIGLEAGVIAVLGGREDAARASWQSVIDTQPESLAAQTAQNYLAQLPPKPDPTTIAPSPSETPS